jgi:hypothetical protein
MDSSAVDLLSRIRKSLADLAELYAVLDEGALDAVKEVKLGLQAKQSVSATGLAASRISPTLYFSLPQDAGPENLTVFIGPDGNLVIQLEEEIEWMAFQVFVNLDASKERRLFIESRYAGPAKGQQNTFPLEYFFRFYTPASDRFHDTPIQRDRIRFDTDVFHLQKVQRGPEIADFTGRNCLILFYPRPARRILISKARIYCI